MCGKFLCHPSWVTADAFQLFSVRTEKVAKAVPRLKSVKLSASYMRKGRARAHLSVGSHQQYGAGLCNLLISKQKGVVIRRHGADGETRTLTPCGTGT